MQTTTARTVERKRTASREVRRQQLIDATIDSIAQYGLSATTMATITKFADLSPGIVNFHFQSKDRLLVEAVGYLADEHHLLWQKLYAQTGPSARERLSALIESDYHPDICNRKKLTVWFAFYGEKKYRDAYRKRCGNIDEDRISETARLCRQIKDEGNYEHVDASMFAQSLEAFTDGLWLNILLYPKTFSRQRAKDECFAYLASVFPDHFSAPATHRDCGRS